MRPRRSPPFVLTPSLGACVALAAMLAVRDAWAQGRTAAPLLQLPASARAVAMGDAYGPAFTAPGDAGAMFYNPAQLAGVRSTAAALSVERYLAASTLGALAVAHDAGRVVLGAGFLALDYPDAEEIVADDGGTSGTPTGATVSAHDLVVAIAAAADAGPMRVGLMARWIGQSLPGANGGTFGVDAGVSGRLARARWGRLSAAAALQHVGPDLEIAATRAPLPRTWRAGLALEDAPLVRARWTALAELTGRRDGATRPRAGLEGAWPLGAVDLAARAGWTAAATGDLARPLTLGAGLRRGRVWLDYAWRDWAQLGATHRVGLRWQR